MNKSQHSGSKNEDKKMKNPASSSGDQAGRLKAIEETVTTVLESLTQERRKDGHKDASVEGGVGGRLQSIEKMVARLKEVVKDSERNKNKEQLETEKKQEQQQKTHEQCGTRVSTDQTTQRIEKRKRYRPIEEVDLQEQKYDKYYLMTFNRETLRSVNPYAVVAKIEEVTGERPKEVTGYNSTSMTVEVRSKSQAENMHRISKVEDFTCETTAHPKYNFTKALIYTYEFDIENLEEFKAGLQERYNITDVQQAGFIKTKSEQTRAFIVYFKQKNIPYTIYIPGEKQDTRVFQFKNKPLICNKCQSYGHSRKWCKSKDDICRKCSTIGHDIAKCTAEISQCYHCKERHQTGSRECVRQQKEQLLVEIQEKERVTIRRARQIIEGETEAPTKASKKFPTHFNCMMGEENKRKFTPWLLEKSISNCLGSKPRTIRTLNNTTFVVEVVSKEQGAALANLNNIHGNEVRVEVNNNLSVNKGLIHVYGYNMTNFERFKKGLIDEYGLANVTEATWMKRNNSRSTPLILDFRGEMPEFIEIPGEQAKTKVIEFKRTPMLCRNCQEFGHGKKWCTKPVRCGKCSEEGHEIANCEATEMKCWHCEGDHGTGSRMCKEYKYQEEILAVQSKERVTRQQAVLIFEQRNPQYKTMNYSEAVKGRVTNERTRHVGTEADGEVVVTSEEAKRQDNRTEVVCMSPGSGELYTTKVNLAGDTPGRSWEDEGTSETNDMIREEVRAIFEESEKHPRAETDINEDVEQYERELKKAKVSERRERNCNSTRERLANIERKDRKRSRSPRSERSLSSPKGKRSDRSRSKHRPLH